MINLWPHSKHQLVPWCDTIKYPFRVQIFIVINESKSTGTSVDNNSTDQQGSFIVSSFATAIKFNTFMIIIEFQLIIELCLGWIDF